MTDLAAQSGRPRAFYRVRFTLVVLLCWAGFYFLANNILGRGFDRPIVIFSSATALLAAPLALIVLAGGTWLGMLITGSRHPETLLSVVCVGLALWAFSGGTMEQWLIQSSPTPGPPRSGPYVALLPDYVFLLIALIAAATAAQFVIQSTDSSSLVLARRTRLAFRSALGLDQTRSERLRGIAAVGILLLAAAILITLLSGPSTAEVRRGQVLFATAAAFALGTAAAHKITGAQHPVWYWVAPIAAGLLGIGIAICKPDFALPADYRKDMIPAWALVRPLPIEMVGAGAAAALLTLRTLTAVAAHHERATTS